MPDDMYIVIIKFGEDRRLEIHTVSTVASLDRHGGVEAVHAYG